MGGELKSSRLSQVNTWFFMLTCQLVQGLVKEGVIVANGKNPTSLHYVV